MLEVLNNPSVYSLATVFTTLVVAQVAKIVYNRFKSRDTLAEKKFSDNINQRRELIEEIRLLRQERRNSEAEHEKEIKACHDESSKWADRYYKLQDEFTDYKLQREDRRKHLKEKVNEAKEEMKAVIENKAEGLKEEINQPVPPKSDIIKKITN